MAHGAGVGEAEPFVQRDARAVRRIDAADHDVMVLLASGVNQPLHERHADAFAALVAVHIDRVLHRVLVGGPGAEGAVAGKAEELAAVDGSDHGESAGLLRVEPADHGLRRARLVVVERRRADDCIVENLEDRQRVRIVRARDELHQAACRRFRSARSSRICASTRAGSRSMPGTRRRVQ